MPAENQNFQIVQGKDKIIEVNVVDDQDPPQPVPITGYTSITWTADTDPPINKSLGFGITVTDGPGGVYEIAVDAADTVTVDPLVYCHKSDAVTELAKDKAVMSGTMTVVVNC